MDTDFSATESTPLRCATPGQAGHTEDSQLCVLGGGNAPNLVCVLATRLRPQGPIALL
jgi:hypothetical protein